MFTDETLASTAKSHSSTYSYKLTNVCIFIVKALNHSIHQEQFAVLWNWFTKAYKTMYERRGKTDR